MVRVSLREIPLPEDLGGQAVLVIIRAREDSVTAMEALEAELSARADFPTLLAGIARHFLNLPYSEVETGIYRSLSALGRVSHCQRAYLFLVGERGTILERAFGWSAPKASERNLSDVEGMALEQFPWTIRHFTRGETVLVSDPEDLPEEAEAERALCKYLGVRSFVNVPLKLRGRLAGWIGVDDHRSRVWSDEEIGVLRATGGLLMSAWEGKRRDEQLYYEQERAQRTLDCIGDGVICVDVDGRIEYVNPIAERLVGLKAAEARGRLLTDVLGIEGEDDDRVMDILGLSEDATRPVEFEGALITASEENRIIKLSVAPMRDPSNRIRGAVLALRDVTEARKATEQAEHHASHDPLTGLVNRREFERRLQRAVESASQRRTSHALCYLDLDDFKVINDTAGHSAGDEALSQVAEVITGRLRSRDTLARLGGDEFGLLLEDCDAKHAWEVCTGLVGHFKESQFSWQGRDFSLGLSIGITAIHEGCDSPSALLTEADQACYRAKYLGRGRVQIFTPGETSQQAPIEPRMTATELEESLSLGRVELHWQPVEAGLGSGQVLYREILCRIASSDGTLLGPDDFMPVARRNGLLPALDCLVMQCGLSRAEMHADDVSIGFNVGRESFRDEESRRDILRLVAESGFPANRVWFELMEPDVAVAMTDAKRFVEPLVSAGCRIVLDGVSGGLGTLQIVEALPIAAIKAGRPLVGSREGAPATTGIMVALLDMCRAMDLILIGKDVVHGDQATRLAHMGVSYLQGGAVAEPVVMP
jgi:diguanylate cyclase (GGDEF)-like protein/PAS domain S-box-containing protein